MSQFSEQDKEIIIDIIGDKLNEVIVRRVDSLHSIDILMLAVEVIDQFDTLFSFILHTAELTVICKSIINKLNKAGVPVVENDIQDIIHSITKKTGKQIPK